MTHTLSEILSQPAAWEATLKGIPDQMAALDEIWIRQPIEQIIFTGCGSAYYLSMSMAALYQSMTGLPAFAAPASELVLFPNLAALHTDKTLLVATSKSGETSETLAAIRAFRNHFKGPVVGITISKDNSLAKAVDVAMIAPVTEQSIVQTRALTSMMVLAEALVGHLAAESARDTLAVLPELGEHQLSQYHDLAHLLGENTSIERFSFLGMGELWGMANESMLKIKEMAQVPAEAFHTMEFRHGPNSMVDEKTLVVGLLTTQATALEAAVLQDMHQLGAHILAISENGSGINANERWHE